MIQLISLTTLLVSQVLVFGQALTGNDTCEDVGLIKHFDWDDLTSNATVMPEMSYSLDVEVSTLELVIEVDLEYIGYAYADDHTYGYGTTFVLDFEDYDAESDDIRLAGNCQNRFSSDFVSPSFAALWQYSSTPAVNNHLGNESYLSYPPSGEYWDLSIDTITDVCTPIHYEGRFTWSELRGCMDYDGLTEYTVIETDANWLNLSGVFYINLVSPLSKDTDLGYYRVYQMLSAPFTIALRNQINIMSSVGINLFTITIIAVYKEDLETDFRLIVLTESADFLMLSTPFLLDSPTLNPDTFNFSMVSTSINEGCLTASSNICSQLWEIYANDVSCPPTNFTGNYGLQFVTTCNPDANYTNGTELCNNYIDQYGSDVVLSAPLEWFDNVCNPETFIIEFDAEMLFYNTSLYNTELGENDQYALGDMAYVEINVATPPDSAFDLIELNLENVWVCTTDPDNEPLAFDSNLGTGGCLSSGSIIDVGFPWHLVVNGEENDLTPGGDVTVNTPFTNGTIRFSFMIDSSISRVNLYIQAQVTLDLVEGNSTRRRLLQIESQPANQNNASQTRHFDGATGIDTNIIVADIDDDGDDDIIIIDTDDDTPVTPEDTDINQIFIYIIIGAVVVGLCCMLICCGAGIWCYFSKQQSMKMKMEIAMQENANRNRTVTISTDNTSRKNTASSTAHSVQSDIGVITNYNNGEAIVVHQHGNVNNV